MNKRLRTILNIVLILALLTGAGMLVRQRLQWRGSAAASEKAAEIARAVPPRLPEAEEEEPNLPPVPEPATGSEDPVVRELEELDLAALREINPDVAGWLYIPDGDISYPILQGPDNDYYLHHTWEKEWNGGGSIFLDWRSSRDFEDFNTLVYGHRMRNGTMFGPLHRYAEQDYWAEHPSIYLVDEVCVRRYEIFAAWEPEVASPVYDPGLEGDEARRAMIAECLAGSALDTGVVPCPEDKLLTLSTCTGQGHATRWVVQGRLAETYP